MTDIGFRVVELGLQGRCCTQIMVRLALEERGEENEQMAEAVGALCFGHFSGIGCGALSGERSPCGSLPASPWMGSSWRSWSTGSATGTGRRTATRSSPAIPGAVHEVPGIVAETYARARALVEDRGLWSPVGMSGQVHAQLCPSACAGSGRVRAGGDEVWLRRVCPEHRESAALVWSGAPDFDAWRGGRHGRVVLRAGGEPRVPHGVRAVRRTRAADLLRALEVTQRCDLSARCASRRRAMRRRRTPRSGRSRGGTGACSRSPPAATSSSPGASPRCATTCPRSSRSGARSARLSPAQHQRAAPRAEPGYAERLADAGLSTVFLQFDGVDDAPYLALRGRPLAAVKEQAVLRCAEAGLGVVLVPTVVRGVNLDRLGEILEYALPTRRRCAASTSSRWLCWGATPPPATPAPTA